MYGVNVVAVLLKLSLYCLTFCHLLTGSGLQSYATETPEMATECRPGMYCRRAVGTLSELRRGDHIRVDRGVYHHHMMVVSVVSADKVTVIHYTGVENLEKAARYGCQRVYRLYTGPRNTFMSVTIRLVYMVHTSRTVQISNETSTLKN